jgi:hypothetical protein
MVNVVNQVNPTPLTSEAYGCFWIINKTLKTIPEQTYGIHITLLLDNKSLITSLKKLRQQPNQYPTKCMIPEYNIIAATVKLMQKLPNITIQYTKSKTNVETCLTERDGKRSDKRVF